MTTPRRTRREIKLLYVVVIPGIIGTSICVIQNIQNQAITVSQAITVPVITPPAPITVTPITVPVITPPAPITVTPITVPVITPPAPITVTPIT
jgi:hypothetical protein